ncbi:unnamed protein product, partial [Tetraodon nigroviridis]
QMLDVYDILPFDNPDGGRGNKVLRSDTRVTSGTKSLWSFFWCLTPTTTLAG